jgi:hypothetical protein
VESRLAGDLPDLFRMTADVDVESESLAGAFKAVLICRRGPSPAVRLQLLPDVGGKALDLVVEPSRIRGHFPQSGESIDLALPEEAKVHPLVFLGVTLLERFGDARGRVIGVEPRGEAWHFALRSFTGTVVLTGDVDADQRMTYLGLRRELRFRWSAFVSWTWKDPEEEVSAPGFRLRVRSRKVDILESIDASLWRLELPVDSR